MNWYVAHVIESHRRIQDPEDEIFAWENLYLIAADSDEECEKKAIQLGREAAVDDPTFTLDGQPARAEFVGVRKIIQVVDFTNIPVSGTELTYSSFVVKSAEDLRRLANGDPVGVIYAQ